MKKSKFSVIVVTGTPGTGKTSLSRELSLLLHYPHVKPFELFKKEISEGYDNIRRTYIVDVKKLNSAIIQLIRASKSHEKDIKGLVIDSHLSHFLPSKYASLCVVARCSSLKTLKKRLEAKGYSAEKVRENLDAEIFDTCLVEAAEIGHRILPVDTAIKTPKAIALQVAKALAKSGPLSKFGFGPDSVRKRTSHRQ